MGRPLRIQQAGDVFHVYARGNRKADIFLDDVDRHTYVGGLGRVVGRHAWRCLAYCLMPNHVHLLVELTDGNLAAGMHGLHGPYARVFNARHGQSGHLFQGRYGAVRVTDDAQLATTLGYIAVNPVTARLVDRPEAWRWGSHRALHGDETAPPWLAAARLRELLAGTFGGDGGARYRELVADRVGGADALTAGRTLIASETSTGAGAGSTVRYR
jgi:REP element-mobilizing transposase RayT